MSLEPWAHQSLFQKKDKIELVPKRLGIYTISIDNKTYQSKMSLKWSILSTMRKFILFHLQVIRAFGKGSRMPLLERLTHEI